LFPLELLYSEPTAFAEHFDCIVKNKARRAFSNATYCVASLTRENLQIISEHAEVDGRKVALDDIGSMPPESECAVLEG
jgi:hypothetical protein